MHFYTKVLIHILVSSTCFEHLMFIIRKTVFFMQFFTVCFSSMQPVYQVEGCARYGWLTLHNCTTMHGTKKLAKFCNNDLSTDFLLVAYCRRVVILFSYTRYE
jgi:hypothetical protein